MAGFGLAFGMEVLACDAFPDAAFAPSPRFSFASLEEVLRRADVVSLHAPALPEGRPLLDGRTLPLLRRGAVLVNTARESLVDKGALRAALEAGQVAAYAVDAFDVEPPQDWSLIHHPRVLATPHLGGFTGEGVDRATAIAVDNLLTGLAELERRGR